MQEYQTLTNRLEKIKSVQRDCIARLQPNASKLHNDFYYNKFCKAISIANELLSRMVDLILDKEGIGKRNIPDTDLGKSFDKLKSTL